ncbi:MAG TPA: hypothetical protein PLY70_10450 [Saprospiraceae bacterium]|nr:hypothetical protein [Saprospiraceae bacterium]HPN70190.1 hypothetical protein [Saprospiraceae bacterium]
MKKWSLLLVFVGLITFNSCKTKTKTEVKDTTAISTGSPAVTSTGQSTFQPKDGFSPVPYGVSLDPNKEKKIREMLGTDTYQKVGAVTMTKELNSQWIEQAKSLIKSRQDQDGERRNEALISTYWVIGGVFKDTMANPQIYAGKWVKFNKDDTFEYGTRQESKGSGIYHYLLGNDTMIMVDNDPDVKPLEFEVGFENGYMVLFGTKSYDDRDLQIKMDRSQNKP